MTNYDDLFEYEDESVRLDFKGAQYTKENHADLLKDLIAFSNADFDGDRFIIIGIIRNANYEKVLKGIEKSEIIDSAVYQQLVRENVEPDINLEYFHYHYQGKDFAIIRIFDCSDKPYLMKKDFGKLRQGDGWIRKGTHQPRLIRRDLDSIGERKQSVQGFSGEVICTFSNTGTEEMNISSFENFQRPSELAAKAISDIIESKRNPIGKNSLSGEEKGIILSQVLNRFTSPYGHYYAKSIEELETDLKNVEKEYINDDLYSLFEEHGTRINFSINNLGEKYIEDASIKVVFPNIVGLMVADQIYDQPIRTTSATLNSLTYPVVSTPLGPRYPDVQIIDDRIEIQQYLQDIRHQIPIIGVFEVPLRIVIAKNLEGQIISIKCMIYGKNLPSPIEKELKIHVI